MKRTQKKNPPSLNIPLHSFHFLFFSPIPLVSAPGWSKLFWLDVFIVSLQVVEALVVFNFIKADDSTRRTATLDRRSSRRSAVSGHRSTEGGAATSLGNDVSGSISQSQASAAGSSRDTTAAP